MTRRFLRLLTIACVAGSAQAEVRVGSKKFTESVLLGEAAVQLLRSGGIAATHRAQLGGTQILWKALLAGEIDAYPEYTGTLRQEILEHTPETEQDLPKALAGHGIRMGEPLGFDDTYAIGMVESQAGKLGIRTLSDLARHPEARLAFSEEFLNRPDGWPAVRERYQMPQTGIRSLDHDLAYRAIAAGSIDATDLYSTDAEIPYYRLRVLADDRRVFPEYVAVFLYRSDLEARNPGATAMLERLSGRIDAATMQAANAGAKLEKIPEAQVASTLLGAAVGVHTTPATESASQAIARRTVEHLTLVGVSLSAAVLVALPLGILASRRRRFGQVILAATSVIQTIPSLALLVFMIPFLGIGAAPAMAALFLYSLLPIVRNTFTGITQIPTALIESADALGLEPTARLRRVELPLALPTILAGIKTSAIINVGTATLGAVIGAGGYGQPILTGIRLDSVPLILQGAVPAAVLALLVQGLFEGVERLAVPRGLRLTRQS